jgi:hypothetical protein
MTVNVTAPAINLREELKKGAPVYEQQQFWFTGDASETDFSLPVGWKPLHVFDTGLLVKEGASDEYTVSNDGYVYTVTFAVAPGSGDDVCIVGVK